jgi:Carboxypeptidase regulatory-like domain
MDVGSNLFPAGVASGLRRKRVSLGTIRTLRGVVTDPSGAVVSNAAVTLKGPGGLDKKTVTADNGSYTFTELPAGTYTVAASAPELTLPQPQRVSLRGGVETLNIQLQVAS